MGKIEGLLALRRFDHADTVGLLSKLGQSSMPKFCL